MFDNSNYVFSVGVPVLHEVKTYFKTSAKIKQVTYGDLVNCTERKDITTFLENDLALKELAKHLGDRYGTIEGISQNEDDFKTVFNKIGLVQSNQDVLISMEEKAIEKATK